MIATIVLSVILICVCAAIILGMVRDKKNGKGCSGDCSHCGGCGVHK